MCVCVCACVHLYLNTCIYTQDEFISSVTRDKELEEEAMRAEQDKLKLRHAFSKVVRIVALYSRCTRALTFRNWWQAEDCQQSLEGGDSNSPTLFGCRFLDGNGFCYAYGTAQVN